MRWSADNDPLAVYHVKLEQMRKIGIESADFKPKLFVKLFTAKTDFRTIASKECSYDVGFSNIILYMHTGKQQLKGSCCMMPFDCHSGPESVHSCTVSSPSLVDKASLNFPVSHH